MSRLASRIGKLEQRHGGCPSCRDRATSIQLVGPDGRPSRNDANTGPCPDCGQPAKVLAFSCWLPDERLEPQAEQR